MGRSSGNVTVASAVLVSVLGGSASAQSIGPAVGSPPEWFEPGAVRIVSGLQGGDDFEDGVWLVGLGGISPREVLPTAVEADLGAGGVVVALVPDGQGFVLRLVSPDGSSIDSVADPWTGLTFDADRDSAFATLSATRNGKPVYRLTRVDIHDGSASPVLPWGPRRPEGALESPDGRWLAWAIDAGEELVSFTRYRGPDGRTRSLGRGAPVGFDLLGRLWYRALDSNGRASLARLDLRTGATRTVRPLTSRDRAVVITPDGRSLVTLTDRDGVGRVRIADLVDGDRWSVRIPVGSQLFESSGRYLLFWSVQGDVSGTTVVDTFERWAGFVPWTNPE